MPAPDRNPRVSLLLQSITAIEVLVLLGAGGGLFFLPAAGGDLTLAADSV